MVVSGVDVVVAGVAVCGCVVTMGTFAPVVAVVDRVSGPGVVEQSESRGEAKGLMSKESIMRSKYARRRLRLSSYCSRSKRTSGFSSRVLRGLAN